MTIRRWRDNSFAFFNYANLKLLYNTGIHVSSNGTQIAASRTGNNPMVNSKDEAKGAACSWISLEYFAAAYYGPCLQKTPVKVSLLSYNNTFPAEQTVSPVTLIVKPGVPTPKCGRSNESY